MTNRKLTPKEKRTVYEFFAFVLDKPDSELHSFIGSETLSNAKKLFRKLQLEEWCKEHGKRFENMTEDDFMNADEEMMWRREQETFDFYEDWN